MNKLELQEQRLALQEELTNLIGQAESRALEENENSRLAEIRSEIDNIDEQIRSIDAENENIAKNNKPKETRKMAKTRLSGAQYVQHGYGQVEPNHLSAQRTAQIYAQLPAKSDINVLENGQFVKYNYKDGVVDFVGAGEWMLVFNEVKVYHEIENDDDFAMKKENYVARVYSPVNGEVLESYKARNYKGVVAPADPLVHDSTDDPFTVENHAKPNLMKEGTNMVPRVFKTNVGDIYTTNCVNVEAPALGDILTPGADGYLVAGDESSAMQWQVVKVYTLADRQPAVKLMRIA